MPCSFESERSVLGKLLYAPERMRDIGQQLSLEDFWIVKHKRVWEAMTGLANQDLTIDTPSVWDWIQAREISGVTLEMITRLDECTVVDLETHVRILQGFTAQRRMAAVADKISQQARYPQGDIAAFLARSTEEIIDVASASVSGQPVQIGDQIIEIVKSAISDDHKVSVRVPTGIAALDNRTGGLLNGQLNLVIARPSMGKTTLLSNVALGLAKRGPVLWFSFEESLIQLQYILTSILCGIPYDDMQRGGQVDAPRIAHATDYVKGLPIFVECSRMPADAIMQRCMSFVGRYGSPAGILLDHVGLIPYTGKSNGFRQTFELIRGLSAIPGRCGCPLLAAHQMNRAATGRDDKRPTLSDMRDAGEEDAKQVWGMHRENAYDVDADPTELEIHVLKNKGPTGKVNCYVDITCARIDHSVEY